MLTRFVGFLKYVIMNVVIISLSCLLMGQERKPEIDLTRDNVTLDREPYPIDIPLLDVYVRLMRYQTARQFLKNSESATKSKSDDFLTIAVSNIQGGKINDLNRDIQHVLNQRTDQILNLERDEMCKPDGTCHLAYNVYWTNNHGYRPEIPSLSGIISYKRYEITVQYQDKSMKRNGIVLYSKNQQSGISIAIIDGIIPDINMVNPDRLPMAKKPLSQYSESRQYRSTKRLQGLRMANSNKMSLISIPKDTPIGYLPEEDGNSLTNIIKAQTTCNQPTPSSTQYFSSGSNDMNLVTNAISAVDLLLNDPQCDSALSGYNSNVNISSIKNLLPPNSNGTKTLSTLMNPATSSSNGNIIDARKSNYTIKVNGKCTTMRQFYSKDFNTGLYPVYVKGNPAKGFLDQSNLSASKFYLGPVFFEPSIAGIISAWSDKAQQMILLHEAIHIITGFDDSAFGSSSILTSKLANKCFGTFDQYIGELYK